MTNSVVVVDDDQQFTSLITAYLSGRGYNALGFTSYTDAKRNITESTNVVLIDIHLGDGDGLLLLSELCRKFPRQNHIILTGDDSLPKRLQSFAKGADDFMKKPLFPSELEARIHRILSKQSVQNNTKIENLILTKSEMNIFEILANAHGQLVPLASMSNQLHDSEAAIYTSISRLRKKLKSEYKIKATYGRGWYLLVI